MQDKAGWNWVSELCVGVFKTYGRSLQCQISSKQRNLLFFMVSQYCYKLKDKRMTVCYNRSKNSNEFVLVGKLQ